ncbi:MAG: hypothetical protein EOO80_01885 [Oxalobacteraceae bacterium]|nr:MAG: hypothetical protein EOO80_01885 [Oxalobacteraceae bacterium]
MKFNLFKAMLIGFAAVVAHGVSAEPVSTQAALQAKQIRLDVQEKQKQVAAQNGADTPAATPAPSAPLELPIDETDSPGATK